LREKNKNLEEKLKDKDDSLKIKNEEIDKLKVSLLLIIKYI